MKLVIAVLNHDDAEVVSKELSKNGYSSTRLDSRGGFLGRASSTMLIGIEDMRLRDVLSIMEKNTRSREYDVPNTQVEAELAYRLPDKVKVGGAVVFVADLDAHFKL